MSKAFSGLLRKCLCDGVIMQEAHLVLNENIDTI